MKSKHDLFWFTIAEASVHGHLAISLCDCGRAKLPTWWWPGRRGEGQDPFQSPALSCFLFLLVRPLLLPPKCHYIMNPLLGLFVRAMPSWSNPMMFGCLSWGLLGDAVFVGHSELLEMQLKIRQESLRKLSEERRSLLERRLPLRVMSWAEGPVFSVGSRGYAKCVKVQGVSQYQDPREGQWLPPWIPHNQDRVSV